jgi:hypothetical protein
MTWTTPVHCDTRYFTRAVASGGVVAGVGYDQLIMMRDGGEWLTLPPTNMPLNSQVQGITVRNGQLLVSADDDVYRFDGSQWSQLGCPSLAADHYGDLAAAGDDLWVTTANGAIYHLGSNGSCQLEVSTGTFLTAIAAASPSRVWAVGDGGTAWSRLPDAGWAIVRAGAQGLQAVAASLSDAYAVDVVGQVFSLEIGLGAPLGGANDQCSNALAVADKGVGDVIYSAGGSDPTRPSLCYQGPGASPGSSFLPTDQGVNALAVDPINGKLLLFGNSSSVLSFPLQ